MIVNKYLSLKKFVKFQGYLLVLALTFIRLTSGLLLIKMVALIGVTLPLQCMVAHNVVSMTNGIIASGAGEGLSK